jgi:hypothetical protein
MSDTSPHSENRPLTAFAIVIGTVFLFASSDVLTKHLATRYPVELIMAIRSVVGLLLILAFFWPRRFLFGESMFGRTLIWLLCCILLSILPAAAQQRAIRPVDQILSSSNKQALVIGNSAYEYTSPLRNPPNDAKEIAKTLRRLRFEVKTLLDADQHKMEQAINDFGNNLRSKKGIDLFYYAGHGVQVQGENYLLPIDIIPQTAADVRYDAVPVGKLLGQMEEADNNMNLVILDDCRRGWSRSKHNPNYNFGGLIPIF